MAVPSRSRPGVPHLAAVAVDPGDDDAGTTALDDVLRVVGGIGWLLDLVVAAQLHVPREGRVASRSLLARTPMEVKVEQVAALLPEPSALVGALREAASVQSAARAVVGGRRPTAVQLDEALARAQQARVAVLLLADAVASGRSADDVHDLDWWARAGRVVAGAAVVPVSSALLALLEEA